MPRVLTRVTEPKIVFTFEGDLDTTGVTLIVIVLSVAVEFAVMVVFTEYPRPSRVTVVVTPADEVVFNAVFVKATFLSCSMRC